VFRIGGNRFNPLVELGRGRICVFTPPWPHLPTTCKRTGRSAAGAPDLFAAHCGAGTGYA